MMVVGIVLISLMGKEYSMGLTPLEAFRGFPDGLSRLDPAPEQHQHAKVGNRCEHDFVGVGLQPRHFDPPHVAFLCNFCSMT